MKQILFLISLLLISFAEAQTPVKSKPTRANLPMELNSFDTIKLQAPDTLGGIPLMQAMQRRHSDRTFKPQYLSLKHLSEILWVANGINRSNGKRTVASSMGQYPLQTYAVLANGIYFYNPARHRLEPVAKGDFRNLAGRQDFVYTAPLNLLFIAKAQNDTDNFQAAYMDSGYCGQNVYLYCASEGLKSVVRASAKETELLNILKLDAGYKFILAQTVGY